MRIAVATDHAGFPLKKAVIEAVKEAGHEPLDLGTNSTESVDHPDFTAKLGRAIQQQEAERGILICGSGVGVCIGANKMRGVYACLCHDTYSARQGVEHDHMNVLCLGSRVIGEELAKECVRAFLSAIPSSEERHVRRVGKLKKLEAEAGR